MSTIGSRAALNVTFVINSLEGGGAERVASILLDRFTKPDQSDPIKLRVVLLDDRPMQYPLPGTVEVKTLGANGSLAASVARLVADIRQNRPDVVLSFLNRANFAAVVAKIVSGVPCVISERVNTTSHFSGGGIRNRFARLLVRVLYRRADRVVAVSGGVADELVENYGLGADRVEVLHNPYDLEAIDLAGSAELEVKLPERFIVAVGRLTKNKNFSLLLRAFAEARSEMELVVLGDGECRAALEAEAQSLGIAERVQFLGFVANPHAIVRQAEAFVSTSNAEGFPNAAAEAMALGKLTVMTDCPSGPAELLDGSAPPGSGLTFAKYGLLTPMNDAASLIEALKVVGTREGEAYGALARERMRSFRADEVADRYMAVLEPVAKRSRADAG